MGLFDLHGQENLNHVVPEFQVMNKVNKKRGINLNTELKRQNVKLMCSLVQSDNSPWQCLTKINF